MKILELWRRSRPLTKGLVIGTAVVLIAAITVLIVFLTSGYYATTMRLLRVEGTVTLQDETGSTKTIVNNMRFQSGQTLNTGAASLASIGLDSDKTITMQENSTVHFTKSRNMMELKLTEGGLFFEVSKPLESDETLDIRTSTMIVGIRGTSGYVFVDEEGRECIIVTSGKVHITGYNPTTHEIKETDATAGQKLTVILYNDRVTGSVEFFLESLTEDQLPAFPLKMLKENAELLARVCQDTGWDANTILGLAGGTVTIPSDSSSLISSSSESESSTTSSETSQSSSSSSETSASSSESSSDTSAGRATPTPRNTATPTPTQTRPTSASSSDTSSSSSDTSGSSSESSESSEESIVTEESRETEHGNDPGPVVPTDENGEPITNNG